jgi:hypothetical protein
VAPGVSLIQSELSDMFSVIKYPEGFLHVLIRFILLSVCY